MKNVCSCSLLFVVILVGCREAPRAQQATSAPQQAPADTPATPTTTAPATTAPTTTAPEDPLHVRVRVRDAADPQSGWLRIEALMAGASLASAEGRWLRQNVIEINTAEAERILIDLRDLPLKSGRRIVLRLDEQGFDMASDIGPVVRFERGRAGVWTRVHDAE